MIIYETKRLKHAIEYEMNMKRHLFYFNPEIITEPWNNVLVFFYINIKEYTPDAGIDMLSLLIYDLFHLSSSQYQHMVC